MICVIAKIPGCKRKCGNEKYGENKRYSECASYPACNLHVLITLTCTLLFAVPYGRRNCEQTERLIDFKCS